MKNYSTGFLFFFLSALLFLSSPVIYAQTACDYKRPHEADRWVFGDKASIDFSTEPPAASATSSFFDTPGGVAAISDADGNLLFFTNGITVWNRFYYVMTNGDGLKGNNFATQPAIILPTPGKSGEYYLFTLDMYIPPVFTDGVNYSIVNFSGGNAGEVTVKNRLLFKENSQKVCAVQHADGRDYWVVFHGFGDNNGGNFYSYLLTDSLVTTPVISTVGSIHKGDPNNGGGYMKASSDGSKIALVIPTDGMAEIFDFNNETGEVSHPVSSRAGQFYFPFGVEFSPDNSKLYLSTSPLGVDTNYLYQFDLTEADPFANPVLLKAFEVNDLTGADSLMGALQLAPDGKIYLSKFKKGILRKESLGVIYNPDRPGLACNYNQLNHSPVNGLYLNGGGSLIGLPTFASNFLNIPHFYTVNQCHHDTTVFIIRNHSNIDAAQWDFADPAGVQADNTPLQPGFVFSEPGTYDVELTEQYGNESYTFTKPVTIHPLPFVDLGGGSDTLYILPGSSVRLDAGEFEQYYWEPTGTTDRYLDVTQEGNYKVTVTDANCCSNYDEVYVKTAHLQFPTAFRPSSTIVRNSEFKIIGNITALAGYHLYIYNRWGQLVFETEDPTEGWNGKINGSPAEMGSYAYTAVLKSFESGVQSAVNIKLRGVVTLIR